MIREELLEPLRRTSRWLLSLRDSQGRIVCPEHRLEHTGKSAGAAVLAARLARHDRGELRAAHAAAAIEQGRRLVANLKREGTSECHTFWPGRHDPFNSSNAIIDGGACSDALVELVEELGSELSADDARAFRHASLLHARTYLRYAVLDKGVPAQRAWGLTGLAAAWRLERDPELERIALEAIGALEAVQNQDGSFPYHPPEWGAPHPGAGDVTSFYHSRIPGFAMFALERLGRSPSAPPFARGLRNALAFLEALQGPDGIKCGLVEAKPWYWGANYEVASHAFDVYALARAWKLYGEAHFGVAALRSYRAWCRHLSPEGIPRSHFEAPGRWKSYQCPVFWACHAEWIARVLPELEELAQRGADAPEPTAGRGIDLRVRHFPQAGLVRLDDGAVSAWIRGARPACNWHHGSPHGAGLLRVVRRSDGRELLERERWSAEQEGEWSASAGGPSPSRGWSHGANELRFSLWLARNHARGGRWSSAVAAPLVVAKRGMIDFSSSAVSSAFELAPELTVYDTGATLRSRLAWRGGANPRGTSLERRFEIDGRGLVVRDKLLASGDAHGTKFHWPAAASERSGEQAGATAVGYRLA